MHAGKIAIDIYLCFHTDLNANQCWTPTLDFIYESVKEVSINLLSEMCPQVTFYMNDVWNVHYRSKVWSVVFF